MDSVVHDPQTGLMAVKVGNVVRLLDDRDLAIAGAVIIRHAAPGRFITPELIWQSLPRRQRTTPERLRSNGHSTSG